MLTLSRLSQIARRYIKDSSITNEELLEQLLGPYVEAGRVKARMGKVFHLDKARTSKIINGKADVPLALKKQLPRVGIEEETARNYDSFLCDYFDNDYFDEFAEEVLDCVNDGSFQGEALFQRLVALKADRPRFFAAVLIAAIKAPNIADESLAIWQNGTASLTVGFGDVLSYGFGREKKYKNIVVIPVNTTFDTEVSWLYESLPKPLVSSKSIHGQWLQRMFGSGCDSETIRQRIAADLASQGVVPSNQVFGLNGSRDEYPIGTVAKIENKKAIFFLVAISSFDENNNAQSTQEEINNAICSILSTYDKFGQGLDMYIPLLGTGMSRAMMSHEDSWRLLLKCTEEHKHQIHGRITVVVHPNDKDKVQLRFEKDYPQQKAILSETETI